MSVKSSEDKELPFEGAALEPYVRYLNHPEYESDFSSLKRADLSEEKERWFRVMMTYLPVVISMIVVGCFVGYVNSSDTTYFSNGLARLGNLSLGV